MSYSVESNIVEVLGRLGQRYRGLPDTFEASVVNAVSYAAAVDQGYIRDIIWADLTFAQRAAIIFSMQKRKGQPRKWEGKGLQINRFTREPGGPAYWTEIIVPPAGMLIKSVKPVKAFGGQLLARLPKAFGEQQLRQAVAEIAFFAQSVLVDNTPVDDGVLIKGWEPKL